MFGMVGLVRLGLGDVTDVYADLCLQKPIDHAEVSPKTGNTQLGILYWCLLAVRTRMSWNVDR